MLQERVALLKDKRSESENIVIVITQHGGFEKFGYTLRVCFVNETTNVVYRHIAPKLTALPPVIPHNYHVSRLDGAWSGNLAGGCSNNIEAYFQNPRIRISVPHHSEPVRCVFALECAEGLSVNLRFFRGILVRQSQLSSAVSSGAYSTASCVLTLNALSPGDHTVVLSSYRKGVEGKFRFVCHSSHPVKISWDAHPFSAEKLTAVKLPGFTDVSSSGSSLGQSKLSNF